MKRITLILIAAIVFALLFTFAPVSYRSWNHVTKGSFVQAHAVASISYDLLGCGILYNFNMTQSVGAGPQSTTSSLAEWRCGPPIQ